MIPPTRYFPLAPLSFAITGGSSVILLLTLAVVTVVSVASITPPPCRASFPFRPWISPLIPYPPLCRPSGSCVYLILPLGHFPQPWPPISLFKDEDVCGRTGKGEVRRSTVGGSALRRKLPSSPITVVEDGISHPLFLHLTQQYHSVHCRPEFRHLHALADAPILDQV